MKKCYWCEDKIDHKGLVEIVDEGMCKICNESLLKTLNSDEEY